MNGVQKGKAPLKQGLFLFLVVILTLSTVYFWQVSTSLEYSLTMVNMKTGQMIMKVPVLEGESFQIHYIHSVDRLPVQETFKVNQGNLVLDQVRWMSFGAGLGYMGQGELKVEGEWIIIEKMNRRLDSLPLRVGTIADHCLVYRGEEYPLRNYVEGMDLVQFAIAKD